MVYRMLIVSAAFAWAAESSECLAPNRQCGHDSMTIGGSLLSINSDVVKKEGQGVMAGLADDDDANLKRVTDEYSSFKDTVGLPTEGRYTWDNFKAAVKAFNDKQQDWESFPCSTSTDTEECAKTLLAFLANAKTETGDWQYCKELKDDGADYTYALQSWSTTKCNNGASASSCTNYKGESVVDTKKCFFGRGSLQVSWPANYNAINDYFAVDVCNDPDEICNGDDEKAWLAGIVHWMLNRWSDGKVVMMNIDDSICHIVKPADCHANNARHTNFNTWAAALSVGTASTDNSCCSYCLSC